MYSIHIELLAINQDISRNQTHTISKEAFYDNVYYVETIYKSLPVDISIDTVLDEDYDIHFQLENYLEPTEEELDYVDMLYGNDLSGLYLHVLDLIKKHLEVTNE